MYYIKLKYIVDEAVLTTVPLSVFTANVDRFFDTREELMSYEEIAKAAFKKARDAYKGTYRSPNKAYFPADLDTDPDTATYGFRRDDQNHVIVPTTKEGMQFTKRGQTERISRGMDILDKYRALEGQGQADQAKKQLRSGLEAMGCDELAFLSRYHARKALKPKINAAVFLKLLAPADHGLCVVGEPALLTRLNGAAVNALGTTFKQNDDAWAVDPWLGVCCLLHDYPNQARQKLNLWQSRNKRLSWNGAQGAGWYPPGGEYAQSFLAARLQLGN
jgi:hypothetical protein